MILAGTGHRGQKIGFSIGNPIYKYVYEHTVNVLKELRPEKVISGLATGFDTLLCEACFELKIPILSAIPFLGQELFWSKDLQEKYKVLLAKSEEIKIVSRGGYSSWKMMARNKWMIDNCDEVIACFDGSFGGTKNTYDYATKCKKKIHLIDPKNATIIL